MIEKVIITSPSLDKDKNVGGVSAVTEFLIKNNTNYSYRHFKLGKQDGEKRGVLWFLRILKAWIKWFFLILFNRNILIHFNLALEKPSAYRDLPLIFYAKIFKRKILIHLHGGQYLQKRPPEWINFLYIMLFTGKDKIIVLSPIEKRLVIKNYRAENVEVLPNSIDIADAESFSRNNYADQSVNLLYIGRLVREKGLDYIFDALRLLVKRDVSFRFYIAGSGPEKNYYVDKFSREFGSQFSYMGIVKGDEKNDLFKLSHIFLLPSFYEGLPISLLECMSFGIVPIVTNVGSVEYAVTDSQNGFFVGQRSADEIAEKVEKLTNDRVLLEQMSRSAFNTIRNKFHPSAYIGKLNEIYQEIDAHS